MTIISIITILRIVIYFQRRHESTFKRFGPSVGLCGDREKEQNPCVPNWIWRDHECIIVNTWRPNHKEVQSVTAVKWFRRERVAVNRCTPLYLMWPSTVWPQSTISFFYKVQSRFFFPSEVDSESLFTLREIIFKRDASRVEGNVTPSCPEMKLSVRNLSKFGKRLRNIWAKLGKRLRNFWGKVQKKVRKVKEISEKRLRNFWEKVEKYLSKRWEKKFVPYGLQCGTPPHRWAAPMGWEHHTAESEEPHWLSPKWACRWTG